MSFDALKKWTVEGKAGREKSTRSCQYPLNSSLALSWQDQKITLVLFVIFSVYLRPGSEAKSVVPPDPIAFQPKPSTANDESMMNKSLTS